MLVYLYYKLINYPISVKVVETMGGEEGQAEDEYGEPGEEDGQAGQPLRPAIGDVTHYLCTTYHCTATLEILIEYESTIVGHAKVVGAGWGMELNAAQTIIPRII